ncbi:hypothetical protein JMJ77_0010099, partial [Colletotrichum scovillei]
NRTKEHEGDRLLVKDTKFRLNQVGAIYAESGLILSSKGQ